jgi:hypothetical protein
LDQRSEPRGQRFYVSSALKTLLGTKKENFRLQWPIAREPYHAYIITGNWCSENESATEIDILYD